MPRTLVLKSGNVVRYPKRIAFLALISLIIVFFQVCCTCDYDFTYRGKVVNGHDQQPLAGAEIRTLDHDLYAIDPGENNQSVWGEPALSDSSGDYKLRTWGLYDCGPGRPDIDDPGDLGWVCFHIEKQGYLTVDTAFDGTSLPDRGSYWEIPTVSLLRDDSSTAR